MIYKIISLEDWEIERNRFALQSEDKCYYYMTYDPYSNLQENHEKQVVVNLKISNSDLKDKPARKFYKDQSITQISKWLVNTISNHTELLDYLWIPASPSKSKSDENYDNRLIRILDLVKKEIPSFNFFDAFFVKQSVLESHKSNNRDVQKKLDNLGLNEKFLEKLSKNKVVIFDDVLTTGSTFKAAQTKLLEVHDALKIIGIFIAKTVCKDIEYEEDF
jgi:hypothetical protein